jgi:hypothetical protein
MAQQIPLPGLVPGIHVFVEANFAAEQDVDGRVKPGQGVFVVVPNFQYHRPDFPGQPCAKAGIQGH